MAATTATVPTALPAPRRPAPRRRVPAIEQPPRVIWPDGPAGVPEDVSGLEGGELFAAITVRDRDQWDYARIAAESGRSVSRVCHWAKNAWLREDARRAGEPFVPVANDATFILPHGHAGRSPWWLAGEARRVLIQIGVMDRRGVSIPYKPTGRPPGSKDRVPRQRWTHAPMRDTAPAVLAAYQEMTGRAENPMTDRQARAELCERFGLNRAQLTRRIASVIDNTALRDRFVDLAAALVAEGATMRHADAQARATLAEETGLTRRQLAARIAAAGPGR